MHYIRIIIFSNLVLEYELSLSCHQIVHVVNIVYRCKCHENRFLGLEKVPQVRPIIPPARRTVAFRIYRHAVLARVPPALYVDLPLPGQQCPVPRQSRGVARIHGVDAVSDRPQYARLVGDAQEVTRLAPSIHRRPARVLVQEGHHPLQQFQQLVAVLAQAATDGVPVERQRRQVIQALLSQRTIQPAVHHAVHRLLPHVPQMLLQAARLPPVRPLHRVSQNPRIDVVRRQLVQRNDDVGPERLLCPDRALWRQEELPSVAVRTEDRALFGHPHRRGRGGGGIAAVGVGRFPVPSLVGCALQLPARAQLLVDRSVRQAEHLKSA
mmetsp:Transcript_41528/g.88477  ORF Transcript_41528/g.88477 Transcript_41528/m.88477 type:complete len:324 (-) Transcript_41528:773-1744(-)